MNFLKRLIKWWTTKPKNPQCECEVDCGARVIYGENSARAIICPTVMKRQTAFLHTYPWNQIGKNGQVLVVDTQKKTLELRQDDRLKNSTDVLNRIFVKPEYLTPACLPELEKLRDVVDRAVSDGKINLQAAEQLLDMIDNQELKIKQISSSGPKDT